MSKSLYLINPKNTSATYYGAEVCALLGYRPVALMGDLAITTVAALAPDDFDVRLCDEVIEPADLDSDADFIGITGKSTQGAGMIELAAAYRRRGKVVIIGGPFASLCPEVFRGHCDILVLSEIEVVADRLFSDLRSGVWHSEYRGGQPDLTRSPVPRWDLYPNDRALLGVVQTSRGCPFVCEFCDVIEYAGRKQRHKDVVQVLAELDQLYQLGYREVFLADDNLTVYRRRAKELLAGLAQWNRSRTEGRVLFSTQVSIDAARDKEMLRLCVEAGLIDLYVGIETPNEESLRETKKRQNVGIDLVEQVEAFVKHGIAVKSSLMVGFDADGLDIFEQHDRFACALPVPILQPVAIIAPTSTPLFDRIKRDGRLVSDMDVGASMFPWDTNIIPKRMSRKQLMQGLRWLCNRLYDPDLFGERLLRFIELLGVVEGRNGKPTPVMDKHLVRSVDVMSAAVIRSLGRLGEAEFRLLSLALKVSARKPAARWHVMSMLFQYMQIRSMYVEAGFWDPEFGKRTSPFEEEPLTAATVA